jgi:formate--tetrahydrofolate ligase
MVALLKDALKPNLVQTLEGTPTFVHGGPFANIAHGCNSVLATRMGLHYGDYLVTEAGFGADLGAEKFVDIKCRTAGLKPDAVVLVATVRALKMHGGVPKKDLSSENLDALHEGADNLLQHVRNVKEVFRLPSVVAINRFPDDTEAELDLVRELCEREGVAVVLSEVWAKGGAGGIELAEEVIRLTDQKSDEPLGFTYDLDRPLKEKVEAVAKRIYHADGVDFASGARKELETLEKLGYGKLPVCIAKTQYSFSDDASLIGVPKGFNITVRNLKVSAGAGFVVALTGNVMTMPGLPSSPSAEKIDVSEDGRITGLF